MGRRIKAVFFDAGNTLLYLDYQYIQEQAAVEGISTAAESIKRSEYNSRRAVDAAMAAGGLKDSDIWPMYFSGILRGIGMNDAVRIERTLAGIRERNTYFGLWVHVPDEVRSTLSRLRNDGYKLGIISNSDGSLSSLLEKTGMAGMVDFALDSFVVGCEKPAPGIFKLALEKAGEPPEACIHVGDIEAADVAGARGVGIHPVLLDHLGEKSPPCDVISSIPEVYSVLNRLNLI